MTKDEPIGNNTWTTSFNSSVSWSFANKRQSNKKLMKVKRVKNLQKVKPLRNKNQSLIPTLKEPKALEEIKILLKTAKNWKKSHKFLVKE